MKYLNKSFSVYYGGNSKYRENYDKVFRKEISASKDDQHDLSEEDKEVSWIEA